MRRARGLVVVTAALSLVACGNNSSPPAAQQSTTTTAAPTPAAFTGGTTQVSTPPTMPGYLTNVAVGSHPGFDRVVFTFSNLLPGYRIGPVTGPFTADGSGDPVPVIGPNYLEAHFSAAGYDSAGSGSQTYNGPLSIPAPAGAVVITELKRTGDFEGYLTWIIGASAPVQFTVVTLTNPIRVVVDLAPQ